MSLTPPKVDNQILTVLKAEAAKLDYTPIELINATSALMVEVEKTPIKGKLQKELVIYLLRVGIENSKLDADQKSLALTIIDSGAIEATIDLVVAASKGIMPINSRKCLPCF